MPQPFLTLAQTRVPVLLEAGADFYVFGEACQDGAAFGADAGGYDHAVGLDAAEFARGEVDDHYYFAADQGLWLVVLGDASADLADFGADVYGELEELVGADDAFGGFHLAYAHLDFGEIFDADFFGWGGSRCCRSASGNGCRGGSGFRSLSRAANREWCVLFFVLHGFDSLQCFGFVNSWEERLRFAKGGARSELSPAEAVEMLRVGAARLPEKRPDAVGALRQGRMRERGDDAQQFGGGVEDRGFAQLVGIGVAESPRLFGGEIFVGGGDDRPDLFQRAREREILVGFEDLADGGLH